MRRADLQSDPRFASAALRLQNLAVLHELIQNWIYTFAISPRSMPSWMKARSRWAKSATSRISRRPSGPIIGARPRRCPNRHRREVQAAGRPWRFSTGELTPLGRPAFQGEDNREVFREFGVSDSELDRLEATGALVADAAIALAVTPDA